MDPPTAKVALEATLYDRRGAVVETENVTGQVQKRINTFAAERSTGELVGEAAHDAAQRLATRASLSQALKKLAKETP